VGDACAARRLMEFLTALGHDVKASVTPPSSVTPSRNEHGEIFVTLSVNALKSASLNRLNESKLL